MKFIVDECTGAEVVRVLRSMGHDVLAVAEAMPQADDQEILNRAQAEGRILVTNDRVFGDLVFRRVEAHRGVPLLRLRDESPANRVRVVQAVVQHHADRLAGHFTVATDNRVRFRPIHRAA